MAQAELADPGSGEKLVRRTKTGDRLDAFLDAHDKSKRWTLYDPVEDKGTKSLMRQSLWRLRSSALLTVETTAHVSSESSDHYLRCFYRLQ